MQNNKKEKKYKVGKAAIVGRPNSGKSSLLNAIVGQKVAMVSDKPQTTQSRITAVYEDERGQIFFRDTPGLFESKLGIKKAKAIIKQAISDVDVIIYVMDGNRSWGDEEDEIKNVVVNSGKTFLVVFNKSDLGEVKNKDYYVRKLSGAMSEVLEVSALKGDGVKNLVNKIFDLMPQGKRDKYVDDHVSPLLSQNSREYLAELVREKVFRLTKQEIPYQVEVLINSVISNEVRGILKLKGKIKVSDEKYKAIIIGKEGKMINKISKMVRDELVSLSNKKVYVELKVI